MASLYFYFSVRTSYPHLYDGYHSRRKSKACDLSSVDYSRQLDLVNMMVAMRDQAMVITFVYYIRLKEGTNTGSKKA